MKKEDKYIARIQFKLKVLQSKGQTFEDFFVSVMTKADKDFQPVKAYGNIGDQKNENVLPSICAGRYNKGQNDL